MSNRVAWCDACARQFDRGPRKKLDASGRAVDYTPGDGENCHACEMRGKQVQATLYASQGSPIHHRVKVPGSTDTFRIEQWNRDTRKVRCVPADYCTSDEIRLDVARAKVFDLDEVACL